MRFEHRSVTHEKVSLSAKINVADGPLMNDFVFKIPVSVYEIFEVTSDAIGHHNYLKCAVERLEIDSQRE